MTAPSATAVTMEHSLRIVKLNLSKLTELYEKVT